MTEGLRTPLTTWAEHLAWCKMRAKAELLAGGPDEARNAISSMGSDIDKFDGEGGPKRHIVAFLVMDALLGPSDTGTIVRWIDGWN